MVPRPRRILQGGKREAAHQVQQAAAVGGGGRACEAGVRQPASRVGQPRTGVRRHKRHYVNMSFAHLLFKIKSRSTG